MNRNVAPADTMATINSALTDDPVRSLSESFGPWLARTVSGTLTTRTNASSGVLTLPNLHGIVVGQVLDLSWGTNLRREMTVTASNATTITVSGGLGTDLPNASTAIQAINIRRLTDDLTATVAGDVNGDGREDLILANRAFVTANTLSPIYPGYDLGRVYVITGRAIAQATTIRRDAAELTLTDEFLGQQVFGLGDLNRDGFDDFAVSRSREGETVRAGSASNELGETAASVFIYRGSESLGGSQRQIRDLFRSDFSNTSGWVYINSQSGTGQPVWHQSTYQQYSLIGGQHLWYGVPGSIDYNAPGAVAHSGAVASPPIVLGNSHPVTLSFNYLLHTDEIDGRDIAEVRIARDEMAGTVSNRVSDSNVVLSVPQNHPYTINQSLSVTWFDSVAQADRERRRMTVTAVTANSITLNGGVGSNLPSNGTRLQLFQLIPNATNQGSGLLQDPTTSTPNNPWRRAQFDLSAYANSTVRVSFNFDTVTGGLNNFRGWHIDDMAIQTTAYAHALTRQNLTGFQFADGGLTLQSGDYDNDGRVDLAVGETSRRVFLQSGSTQTPLSQSTQGQLYVFEALPTNREN